MNNKTVELTNRKVENYDKQWEYRDRKPKQRPFVVWDGEGMSVRGRHEYTYLCAYDGTHFTDLARRTGLRSEECLDLLIQVAKKNRNAIHVVYGGSYDFNMMLRDVPRSHLEQLWERGWCEWKGYHLSYTPRKSFSVRYLKTKVVLWDVIGFFQGSFVSAITTWDVDLKAKELDVIRAGKAARGTFTDEQFDTTNNYCRTELKVFMRLMLKLDATRHRLDMSFGRWDGAGAVAACYLRKEGIRHARKEPDYQSSYYEAVRCAYAGGRIELISPGDHYGPIYHYDINSAYPSAITLLPNLSNACITHCKESSCEISDFDLVKFVYWGNQSASVFPLHHRQYDGTISFPLKSENWHWGIEYNGVKDAGSIQEVEHYHFEVDRSRPFRWVDEQYKERERLKSQGLAEEKVIKLGLNSIYGKLAQQRGWKPGRKVPTYHQLEWAGWITARTRALIWQAIKDHVDDIIAIETDGIYSRVPLNVPLGKNLGQWEYEKLKRITYVQSGVYFVEHYEHKVMEMYGREVCKFCRREDKELKHSCVSDRYRGMDQGSLTREKLIKNWERYSRGLQDPLISLPSTRFITLGAALQMKEMNKWRQWPTATRELSLIPVGKRYHSLSCECNGHWQAGQAHHTLPIAPDPVSSPFAVKWVSPEDAARHLMLEMQLEEEREDVNSWE